MKRTPTRSRPAAWLTLILGAACGDGGSEDVARTEPAPQRAEDPAPPTARWEQVRELQADLKAIRHASDGGGAARLVTDDADARGPRAGSFGRWTLEYETGPLGVAEGGAIYFMPEPFWGWSPPQDVEPRAAGFTTVETEAPGVVLETESVRASRSSGLLVIIVRGRALAQGETVRIVYGAGAVGAQTDMYAGRDSRLWFAVDGDGDGVRAIVPDSPGIEVLPGAPERLVVHLPSVVAPEGPARLDIAVLDVVANAWVAIDGRIELSGLPAGSDQLAEIELDREDRGVASVELGAGGEGVVRITARIVYEGRELVGTSNPMWVSGEARRVLWGDLHGHTGYSDGTGVPEDYFLYARDVAALDIVALTDHDHFGVRFLDDHPELWDEILALAGDFHAPGRFVTLPGYEWTSWIHGHRHVLFFSSEGTVHSSLDEAVDTPAELWDSLRGTGAMTLAHHSSGEPIPVNWSYPPDPELEPVTEVVSVHGSSEAMDAPRPVRGSRPGRFVRDVLERGVRLGFVGSGDSHDGHPGLAHLSPVNGWRDSGGSRRVGNGGLAGIHAAEHTRAGVRAALAARDVYATSGPRIVLATRLAGRAMGAVVEAGEEGVLRVDVIATAPIAKLEVVRGGRVESVTGAQGLEAHLDVALGELVAGEYVYVRVVQDDGGAAWSSPYFVEAP